MPSVTPPPVPVGLGTQAGLAGALSGFILGVVGFIAGDRTPESIAALATAAVALYAVVAGRMKQATALTIAQERAVDHDLVKTAAAAIASGREALERTPDDGDDGVHEASDGEPDPEGAGETIDEDESADDPSGDDGPEPIVAPGGDR